MEFFGSLNMDLDESRTHCNPDGTKVLYHLCNNFDSHCYTATMLNKKGSTAEYQRAISKAYNILPQILPGEHPLTLGCFFEVFIHFIQTGLPDLTTFFLTRIRNKAGQENNRWSQILRLLGELDVESRHLDMAAAWKHTAEIIHRTLHGNAVAISFRLDIVKRVYGTTDKEEPLLCKLLEVTPRASTPQVMLNLAHDLNRQRRHNKAKKMAMDILEMLGTHEMYTKRFVQRIECSRIISYSQFYQGMNLEAEQTMRETIRLIIKQWGVQHP